MSTEGFLRAFFPWFFRQEQEDDRIPVKLSETEYWVSESSVNYFGVRKIEALEKARIIDEEDLLHLEIDPGKQLAWCGVNRIDHDVTPYMEDVDCLDCLRKHKEN